MSSNDKTRQEVLARSQALIDMLDPAALPIDRMTAMAMLLTGLALLRADGVEEPELSLVCGAMLKITASTRPFPKGH